MNKLNSPYQFGFSALRGRHDLIARIIELCYKHQYSSLNPAKASSVILSLDIEGAFDNINQDKLIYKMNEEMGNDPIRFWLAEFILNRYVSIRRGGFTSKTRSVCRGVPQGSALGPILWNYAIHDLDESITWSGRIELLRYADDILLIYNGHNMNELQSILDNLVDKLAGIDLNIRSEKCSTMVVTLGSSSDRRKHDYKIEGSAIKQVKVMNILGIPFNNKLKLDIRSKEHKDKLIRSVKKLHSLNNLGLINSAAEWRILIDSFINSRLIINNWPVLLIDKVARDWATKTFFKLIRVIFEWPSNTSIKLIRLITKSIRIELTTQRMARHNETMELGGIYYFLRQLSQEVKRNEYTINSSHNDLENINLEVRTNRKHFDPSKMINIKTIESISEEMGKNGPGWFILDRAEGSMIAEMLFEEVKQIRIGKHYDYQISYFNSFSLFNDLVCDRTVNFRCLFISDESSMLKAIQNLDNHDFRVIELRERIWDNGWRLNIIKKEDANTITEFLSKLYKRLNPTGQNRTSEQIPDHMGLTSDNPYSGDMFQAARSIRVLFQPLLSDYRRRNYLNSITTEQDADEFYSYHTELTRHLCDNVLVWQNLTPNWISGRKLMALSGLYRDATTGSLQHPNGGQIECGLCNNEQVDESANWYNIEPAAIDTITTLHRMIKCPGLEDERVEFTRKINLEMLMETTESGHTIIERILANRRSSQTLLNFVTKCAFKTGISEASDDVFPSASPSERIK